MRKEREIIIIKAKKQREKREHYIGR